jgi:hypothetical protein
MRAGELPRRTGCAVRLRMLRRFTGWPALPS